MKLKARLLVPFFILSVFSINSCSIQTINNDINLKNLNINELKINNSNYHISAENPYSIDLGKKDGSSFKFKIKFSKSDFKIKANEDGKVYTAADIDEIKIILFNQSSFTSGSTISNPTTFGPFTISTSSNSSIGTNNISVNFTNVPGNINPYRVGIQALKDSKVITKATGSYAIVDSEIYAVSDTGGNDNTGQLTIDPINLKFTGSGSPTNPLGTTLNLIDADGATIESQVTINPRDTNVDNIQSFLFYLVDENLNVISDPFNFTSGNKFESLKSGDPTTIKFLNIPQGTYYVAAAAFDNTNANVTDGTDNLGLGLGNFILSDMLTVYSNLAVSNTDSLVLSLNLN